MQTPTLRQGLARTKRRRALRRTAAAVVPLSHHPQAQRRWLRWRCEALAYLAQCCVATCMPGAYSPALAHLARGAAMPPVGRIQQEALLSICPLQEQPVPEAPRAPHLTNGSVPSEAPRALHLTNGSVPHHPDGLSSARSVEMRLVRSRTRCFSMLCVQAAGTA